MYKVLIDGSLVEVSSPSVTLSGGYLLFFEKEGSGLVKTVVPPGKWSMLEAGEGACLMHLPQAQPPEVGGTKNVDDPQT